MIRGLQPRGIRPHDRLFPAGSTLLVMSEPAQRKKFEVRIDNDDLNGDQDILQLSLHSFSDGQEQQDEYSYMFSRITVTLKKQQNIWRLSNVGIGMELPLGDPAFLKKAFFNGGEGKATDAGVVAPIDTTDMKLEKTSAFDPEGIVAMLGMAERSYASQHPEIGFTCSLSELAEVGKGFGLDPQLGSGTYMSYRWSVSGCDGKPAGSFQIVAEPMAQGSGSRAACIDATENLRVLEDGRGSACLTSGKVNAQSNSDAIVGLNTDVHIDPK